MPHKKIHQGQNIKRFREMMGIKREVLAFELGDDWNKQKISFLEQKETVEADIIVQVAKILKVSADVIKNFHDEQDVPKEQVWLTPSQHEFIEFVQFYGTSELLKSLRIVHDLALYHSDVPINSEEKRALFGVKSLWESIEEI